MKDGKKGRTQIFLSLLHARMA